NLPAWLFEGDATLTETLLTEAGRGRQPIVNQTLRTNLLSDRNYSYSKNYIGSYKNLTLNYYTLSHYTNATLRYDCGQDILDKTLTRMANFPIRPYNFSRSLKRSGAYGSTTLYKKTIHHIDSVWRSENNTRTIKLYQPLNNISKRDPGHYLL